MSQYKDKIADYHLNLLDVHSIENLEQYQGELKALFGFIKYQQDQRKLLEFIQKNESLFSSMSPETVQAVTVLGNAKELQMQLLKKQDQREEIDMCKALQDMMEDSRLEGQLEGKLEGKLEGIRIFIEDNLEEGISESRILEKLQRKFSLGSEEAAQYFHQFSQTCLNGDMK